jgi:RNA polymerase sigma-70 factor (ECF subfamily)
LTRDGESTALDGRTWINLLNRLKRRLPASAAAEDLLQSAYLKLERYRQTHEVANPDAFLVQIAVNLDLDERRRRKWIDDRPFDEACRDFSSNAPLQDEVIAARERLEKVKAALDQMPPRTRAIFLQHRIDGLKYREIAEQFGISQSAVEKHIARATLFLVERTEGW